VQIGGWGLIFRIYFYTVLAPASIAVPIPIIGDIAQAYGASQFESGWIISTPAAVTAAAALIGGWIVDRKGDRPVLFVGVVGLLIGDLAVLVAPNFAWLIAARLIEGIGYLGIVVGSSTMMLRITSGHRRTSAMALWATSIPVGIGVVAPLVAPLAGTGKWPLAFVGHAVLAAIGVFAIGLLPKPVKGHATSRTAGLLTVFRRPAPFTLGVAFGASALLQTGCVTVLPIFLMKAYALSPVVASAVSTAQMVTNALGSLAIGPLLNRKWRLSTVTALAIVLALLGGLVLFAPYSGLPIAVIASMVLTIGTGLIISLGMAMLPRIAPSPEAIGATSGLVLQFSLFGVLIGPPIIFAAWATGDWLILAVVVVVTCAITLVLMPVWRRATPFEAASAREIRP
jgi:MFS family permease